MSQHHEASMSKVQRIALGTLLAAGGLSVHLWLWIAAEVAGRGMSLSVKVLGWQIPLMAAVIAGIGLVALGLVVGYCGQPRNDRAR